MKVAVALMAYKHPQNTSHIEQFSLRLKTFGTWQNPRTELRQEARRVLVMTAPSAFSS